jgi:hypothetical protein
MNVIMSTLINIPVNPSKTKFKDRFWKWCVRYGTHRAEMALKHKWML